VQDDVSTNLRNVTSKLKDVEEQKDRMEQHIEQLNKRIAVTEEGKYYLHLNSSVMSSHHVWYTYEI